MQVLERATPESLGIPSGALLNVLERLGGLEYPNSIMVMRHGRVALEAWFAPYERRVPHQIFSLSKSFTSCAVGLARAEGKLRLEDKLLSFFPEYESCVTDPKMRRVTLRDLLTMRSGHEECSTKYMFGTQDYVRGFLSSPLERDPGTWFAYNSGGSYMLASVVRRVTGENVREYLMPRLFEPLGIAPGPWECCPQGTNLGGWGLYLTTEDIARFAQLLLNRGVWAGKQIVPADYLAEATVKHADTVQCEIPDWQQGYGYHFWLSRHGYRGDGASGQYAAILPEQDMAVAVTSCMTNMERVLEILWEEVLPVLSEKPLPEDPAMQRRLRERAENAALPVLAGDLKHRRPAARFRFRQNSAGIRSCEVAFDGAGCALTFATDHGTEQLRAGFGHYETAIFRLFDEYPHRAAACAAWLNDHVLRIHSCILDGIFRDIWTIDFDDPAEPVKHEGVCGCFRPVLPPLPVEVGEN